MVKHTQRGGHDNRLRVVAITGSLRDKSYTTMALRVALDGAASASAETKLLDLRAFNLGFAGMPGDAHPGLSALKFEIRRAHGILLGTPEYHGSFSGVLKNALDLMGFEE